MLAPEFLPVWGGVGTYTIELVRHLPKDIEVHVVTTMREGFGKERILASDYDFSQYFGSNVHVHFVCRASDTFIYNARFQYACLKYVPKLVKEEHLDLIHSHAAHMPDLLLKTRKSNVPTVTTVHTTIRGQREGTKASMTKFRDLEFSEKMTLLTYPFLCLLEEIYFSRGICYITPSRWMKEYLLKNHPNLRGNVFVVPHGVDTDFFAPSGKKQNHNRNVVLFVGRLIALKGIFYLIRAMPLILKEHPNTIFIFIGPGRKDPYIEELNRCGVPKENYSFLSYKDKKSLMKYYSAADIYVLPSFFESFSLTLVEAMSCGVPAVVSRIGGPSEIIEDHINGILIRPGSVRDIADAITFLLDNPTIRKRMGKEARKTIEKKFSWHTTALRTSSIYKYAVDVILNRGDFE
jgi:glycosyltransferase involved in cell wall biosynthesis